MHAQPQSHTHELTPTHPTISYTLTPLLPRARTHTESAVARNLVTTVRSLQPLAQGDVCGMETAGAHRGAPPVDSHS